MDVAFFKYQAVAADGTVVKDIAEAQSASAVENELLRRGFTIRRIAEKKKFTAIEISPERVPRQEIMHFSRQIAAFVRTGIPLIDAVAVVEQGTDNKRFRAILADVREQLQAGVPFSDALTPHAEVFPPYYLGIIRSAELTGQLDIVLDQLSVYIDRDMEARSKVKSALTYPLVVMGMSVVTVIVLVAFVLPRFVKFFKDLGSKLPLPTRMLLGFSDFLSAWWWVLAIAVVVLIAGYVLSGRTDGGRETRHRVFLAMPMMGTIVRYSAIERFCRIIAAMLRAGVPLPEAMDSAIESTNNKVFEKGLTAARDEMLEGDGVAGPLARTELFPPAAVQMMRVGEETGSLDQQADSAANYYARELEYKLKKLTDLFEPAIIVFMGLIVGFVAVALISAMYGVLNDNNQKI